MRISFQAKEGGVKHWMDVINQSAEVAVINIYHLNDNKKSAASSQHDLLPRRHPLRNKHYYAGGNYADIYFTRREAECLYYLLRGMTITATAAQLELSPRTVEFYVKNMKRKLQVKTKYDLMECLHEVRFLRTLEAEMQAVI